MNKEIYLDNNSTTAVDPAIAQELPAFLANNVGNASSADHEHGKSASSVVEHVRCQIAKMVHAPALGVIFTSGATESANLVLQGAIRGGKKPIILLSSIEHACIHSVIRLGEKGLCEVRVVPVNGRGDLDLDALDRMAVGATLGCFMTANNEIGTINPVSQIGKILYNHGVKYLADATQSIGYLPVDMSRSKIDYVIFSAHKIHSLQGTGVLVARDPDALPPAIMFGGEQQRGVRPGTIATPGIWALGRALRFSVKERDLHAELVSLKRDTLHDLLMEKCENVIVRTGNAMSALPNTLHLCIRGVPNTFIINRLRGKVAISTGSACTSRTVSRSHVLRAINLPDELADGALRMGLSRFTTDDEVSMAAQYIAEAIRDVRNML